MKHHYSQQWLFTAWMLLTNVVCFGQYANPVKYKNLPDPSVIYGNDGWFYVYATDNGEQSIPIYKSKDLVNWRFAGGAFTDITRPNFVAKGGLWAPDINNIDGQYVLYYAMSTWGGEWTCGIGVATAPSPIGPFTDHGKLFISSEIGVKNSIDPCYFEDDNGKKYLFWGSFRGIYGVELSSDGLSYHPETKFQVAPGADGNVDHTEATMVVKRNGYYYLFGSSGTCCDGSNSTYHVVVARSRNIKGPYVNKNGYSIMVQNFETILGKSSLVNGPGHTSELIVDDHGRTWMLYHGFAADNPDAGRLLYLDEVKWDSADWPYITGGSPSTTADAPFFDTYALAGIKDHVTNQEGYSITKGEGQYYQLNGPANDTFHWRLYNVSADLVKEGEAVETKDLWLNDIANGVYLIQVKGKYGLVTQKIVKSE